MLAFIILHPQPAGDRLEFSLGLRFIALCRSDWRAGPAGSKFDRYSLLCYHKTRLRECWHAERDHFYP